MTRLAKKIEDDAALLKQFLNDSIVGFYEIQRKIEAHDEALSDPTIDDDQKAVIRDNKERWIQHILTTYQNVGVIMSNMIHEFVSAEQTELNKKRIP